MSNLDRWLWQSNAVICGVDEVGRGALAGPVVAAAVVLPSNSRIPGANDSKLLPPKKRERLALVIKRRAIAWAIGAAGPRFIDRYNIVNATFYAMRLAVRRVCRVINPASPESNLLVLADGWEIPELGVPCRGVRYGDRKSLSIACASIVAKVFRDGLMERLDVRFPGYGLAQHKGYGTPQHLRAIDRLGISPIHRRSFAPLKSVTGGSGDGQRGFG